MAGIEIRGTGLACALGLDVPACVGALEARQVRTETLVLDGLDEPVRMRYYRIPDGAPVFDPERLDALLRRVAREALSAAELSRAEIDRLPIFVGSSCFSVGRSEAEHQALLRRQPDATLALPIVGFQQLATTLQASLGSHGDTYAFNTACTAGANALMVARRMIRAGWYRHALVVGAEIANVTTLAGFSGLQLVAETVRPFDRRRTGIVLGEGVAAAVLSSEGAASGLALVDGASNGDAFSVTSANPDGSTIAAVQAAVLEQAGVSAAAIRGIKSHGTASPMNDVGEAAGIRRVFESPPPVCALKPYLGHTLGACGVNELVLLAAALRQGFFPGTPGFEEEDPSLMIRPTREHTAAPAGHYLLNFFGFGGNNTALLVAKA